MFDWYIDLQPESIDNWEQLEREFINRFYSTCRTVSMMEPANTKQWKDEPVVDYINWWHFLSLDCKDRLSKNLGYGDVHPRHALGASLHPSRDKTPNI